MYVVIVDGRVVCECLSTGTAGGILQFHGKGMIAEVLYEAQENSRERVQRRIPGNRRNPPK